MVDAERLEAPALQDRRRLRVAIVCVEAERNTLAGHLLALAEHLPVNIGRHVDVVLPVHADFYGAESELDVLFDQFRDLQRRPPIAPIRALDDAEASVHPDLLAVTAAQ